MQRIPLSSIAILAFAAACADSSTSPLEPGASLAVNSSETSAEAEAAKTSAGSETIYGVTSGNQLITFSTSKSNQSSSQTITGLAAGESVIGIDFRPSDLNANGIDDTGKLYGVTDASRIYLIDPATGVASSPVTLSVPLTSTTIGVGFNPVPDRLRIHTTSDQNLRINVDNGATLVDGVLRYGTGDANFGVNPQVVATGYTNNDNDSTTLTTLYAIDAMTDALVTFPAATGGPNGGVLATVGSLGVDAGLSTGFDISLSSGTAYAAIATSPSGKSTLYSINLTTGVATKIGMLAQTKSAILSIAVKP